MNIKANVSFVKKIKTLTKIRYKTSKIFWSRQQKRPAVNQRFNLIGQNKHKTIQDSIELNEQQGENYYLVKIVRS